MPSIFKDFQLKFFVGIIRTARKDERGLGTSIGDMEVEVFENLFTRVCMNDATCSIQNSNVLFTSAPLQRPEREAGGACTPPAFHLGSRGAKVPFLNAMICFPVVNMIQQRSDKLQTSNISLDKVII